MLEAARQEGGLATGYIDDAALLVTGDSPPSNCQASERLHSKTAEKGANTWGVSLANMRRIYLAVVIPQLLYESSVWYSSGYNRKWMIEKLAKFQHEAIYNSNFRSI